MPTELADRSLWPGEASDWWEHERPKVDKALATAPSSDPRKIPRKPVGRSGANGACSRVLGTPSFGLPR
ncbi:MAG: hypothetical protein IPL47_14215 [Phyllobacteriaceae bacterium]|nr:hypothetical protein [Phyllobacteriaceae bacterium]